MSSSPDRQLQVEPEISVVWVLHDTELSRSVVVTGDQVVNQTVDKFIDGLFQPADLSRPDIIQIFIEANPPAAATTFASLEPPEAPQNYLIMLAAKNWSRVRERNEEVATHNKENLADIPGEALPSDVSKPITPPFEDRIAALRVELAEGLTPSSMQTNFSGRLIPYYWGR
ncbi:hypothetical protein M413DRAFT_23352 [Hebeloma cylindrosporum]|uniref:Uncharacterized protein n=1 Tax=Hebeloma cylindrosporum TaxID=76867 RepID=A0A0C3CT50_HEBCY|nr:hypothetical protein M413DRAFT_23352 [Hebeloma cylindrosporum h7]